MSKFIQHPTLPQGFSNTFEQRFWSKVDKNGPTPQHVPHLGNCWVWATGMKDKDGYGIIMRGCFSAGYIRSNRASWILHFGPFDDELWVLHRCDNPSCVRPSHLFLGSSLDNIEDRQIKQRGARGEKVNTAVLTEEEIVTIRSLRHIVSNAELAKQFGVQPGAIAKIMVGRTWKHV